MYIWLKAFHIIAVISWMAGLLYLPRLLVYHADAKAAGSLDRTLEIMEYRLAKYIMAPAALVSWGLGLFLAFDGGFISWNIEVWFAVKLVLVILLTAFHGVLLIHVRRFRENRNHHKARYFRIINEFPTVLMIAIVIVVVVKPF